MNNSDQSSKFECRYPDIKQTKSKLVLGAIGSAAMASFFTYMLLSGLSFEHFVKYLQFHVFAFLTVLMCFLAYCLISAAFRPVQKPMRNSQIFLGDAVLEHKVGMVTLSVRLDDVSEVRIEKAQTKDETILLALFDGQSIGFQHIDNPDLFNKQLKAKFLKSK